MTSTVLRPSQPSSAPPPAPRADRHGPLGRIVIASLATGALTSTLLVLSVFAGAPEHVTTGVALLGFALGWQMLAQLTSHMTSAPQCWAHGLAAFLGTASAALLTLAPGDDGLTAAAWVWPPVLLVLLAWSTRRMRASLPGRARWLLYPVLAVLAAMSFGAFAENIALQRDAATTVMPGRLYDVGGHRLHLNCTGAGSPTVVLENSLGGSSPGWARIVAATAGTTRICSYDRAGTGWSHTARGPHDSAAIATDLHQLLTVAGEHGPYVLVGHSTGGVYAMTYAARYPEQVAGLVLLDSASPRQFSVLPDFASQYPMMTRLYAARPVLYRLGVGRLVPALSSNEVPGSAGTQAGIFVIRPRDARAASDEVAAYHRAFTQAQSLTTFGSKPLVVVSASETVAGTAGWSVAQQQLAALSVNSSRRTVRSSHVGLLDHSGSYQASVSAIIDVVQAVRTGTTVRTP